MAGFFTRIANLWRGFLGIKVSEAEQKHPEIAYENAISSMVEKYAALKKATAAIIHRREEYELQLTEKQKEHKQVMLDLSAAIETNQDDLGMVLIQKKTELETAIADLNTELETAVKDANLAKSSLLQVQAEIKKLKAEKERMLAKMASAQARVRIQEQLEGLSVEAEVKALDNVRQHINNVVSQAKLGDELATSSLDHRLAQLRQTSGDLSARQELEAMKAAHLAAKKSQGQRSL